MSTEKQGIVFTLKARCRDCYKCLRHCPVHAIGIKDGQAYVDSDKCIQCGLCVRNCPQHAKTYRNDIGMVKALIEDGRVYASIAPSFAAEFTDWQTKRIPSLLRKLGFEKVFETSEAAGLSAKMAKNRMEEMGHGCIYTACPVVTNFAEKYKPEKLPYLLDTASPMVLHGRELKNEFGTDIRVVFIGPCIAKKGEAEREDNKESIDAVLTFEELKNWLKDANISLEACEESGFDHIEKQGVSRFYPLPGGMTKAAGMDEKKGSYIATSGATNVMQLFDLDFDQYNIGAEPLFCDEGCINGPCMQTKSNLFERRQNLLAYAGGLDEAEGFEIPKIDMAVTYQSKAIVEEQITDAQIKAVYKRTDKENEAQQLNCGACGYSSCREMAIAVIQGNAEEEMCIPYMRRMAQARGDMLMETTPNGIVIVDEKLRIISTNKAFKKGFMCSDAVIGKEISYLLPENGFEELVSGKKDFVDNIINCYGKTYHQILYPMPQERKFTGIYSDITAHKLNEKKLENLKRETAMQAQALLDNQLEIARQMAEFLGKSTAKSELIVERLLRSDE